MNLLIKPAKQVLAKRYGHMNVSVTNGTGTAWGWVRVRIIAHKALKCTGDTNGFYCNNCKENNRAVEREARELMRNEWAKLGLKAYTYASDDGYDTERDEVLISVDYV